jgi:hypothetical protein
VNKSSLGSSWCPLQLSLLRPGHIQSPKAAKGLELHLCKICTRILIKIKLKLQEEERKGDGFTHHLNKNGSSLLPPCLFTFFPPLSKLQHKEGISMQQGRAWAEGSNRVDPTSPPAASKELPLTFLLGEGTRRGGGLHEKRIEHWNRSYGYTIRR